MMTPSFYLDCGYPAVVQTLRCSVLTRRAKELLHLSVRDVDGRYAESQVRIFYLGFCAHFSQHVASRVGSPNVSCQRAIFSLSREEIKKVSCAARDSTIPVGVFRSLFVSKFDDLVAIHAYLPRTLLR